MTDPNLITSIILQGREYLVKMNVVNKYLELIISDKQSGEEWQCSYDSSYIENLTHKTGNYKQFDVFITMIKSGLLKTSESINLELLTFEDLESLRIRKIRNHSSRSFTNSHNNNRRYLILTYTVEFDRIHYPLPLEYCGPPDPAILQASIRKLESELAKTKEELNQRNNKNDSRQIISLQRRIDDLTTENIRLQDEIEEMRQLSSSSSKSQIFLLQKAIMELERSVLLERKSHHKLVEKLRNDKILLVKQLEITKSSERSIKSQLDQLHKNRTRCNYDRKPTKLQNSDQSLQTIYRRQALPLLKPKSQGEKCIRTRSMSPRLIKSDGWGDKTEIRQCKKSANAKPRSRSSSLSSAKNFRLEEFCSYEAVSDKKPSSGCRRNKSKSRNRSRSSSIGSTGSSAVTEKLSNLSVGSIKSRIKTSKKDFQTLENRIQALQNILKENAKCNY